MQSMALRGSAEKRVPRSPLTRGRGRGSRFANPRAIHYVPGAEGSMRWGPTVDPWLEVMVGKDQAKRFAHPLLGGVFARGQWLAMGVCAVGVQAIVCLNDVYEGS